MQFDAEIATVGFASGLSTTMPAALTQLNFKGTTLPRLKVGVVVNGGSGYGDNRPLKRCDDGVDCGVTIATAQVEK